MKVFGLRISDRKMNEMDDLVISGSGDAVSMSSDDSGDDDWEDINSPIGDSADDFLKSKGLDPSKYGLDKEEPGNIDEDVQGSTEVKEVAGQATDEKSILDVVNSLGAVAGDSPIKIESTEQLKNLVQMGHDYTQKTQALSEERKALESERGQVEQVLESSIAEFNQRVQQFETQQREFQQWQYTIEALKSDAPDIFDELQRAFSNTGKQFDNPVLNQKIAALEAQLNETKKGLTERENKLIVDSFETEKAKLSSTEQSLKELGITVDWDAAKKEWAQTGLPLNRVVGSLYMEAMAKAQASKAKVATTKQKVASRPVGAAGSSRPGGKMPAIDPKATLYQRAQQMLNNINKQ